MDEVRKILKTLIVGFFLVLLTMVDSFAGFFEISLTGNYRRTQYTDIDFAEYYGGNVGVAYRFWGSSAIELGFSRGRSKTFRETDLDLGSSIILTQQEEIVDSWVYSVSWKQYLLPPGFKVAPYIRAGYANYQTEGSLRLLLNTGDEIIQTATPTDEGSGIAGAGLNIKFTRLTSLRLEATSVFPDFETSKWQDNIRYSVGLTWLF